MIEGTNMRGTCGGANVIAKGESVGWSVIRFLGRLDRVSPHLEELLTEGGLC